MRHNRIKDYSGGIKKGEQQEGGKEGLRERVSEERGGEWNIQSYVRVQTWMDEYAIHLPTNRMSLDTFSREFAKYIRLHENA